MPLFSLLSISWEEVAAKYGVISFLLCLLMGVCIYADQVIYLEVSDFDRSPSQFGKAVKENAWVEIKENGAILHRARA